MEHVPNQGEVELSLCSMVYLHNISKPSSYSTHTSYVSITMTISKFCFGISFLLILLIIRHILIHLAGELSFSGCSNGGQM
jgi:uncharacterized protein YceK